MKFGIKAREIMEEDFPILDCSLTLEKCIRILNNKYEACVILHNGFLYSVLGNEDLLRAYMETKNKNLKLHEVKSNQHFALVDAETDVFDVIRMIRRGIDFIVVKDKNYLGLITKKEIVEINQLLFDELEEGILV